MPYKDPAYPGPVTTYPTLRERVESALLAAGFRA